MFRRLVATSRAPQIMVLSMLRSFGKIGPQIDQIWAWLSRGHRWSPEVPNPLKSSVMGPSLLVNCYLEIKFHKIIMVNPPPPPPLKNVIDKLLNKFTRCWQFEKSVSSKLSFYDSVKEKFARETYLGSSKGIPHHYSTTKQNHCA